jgi:hypothetical protein
MRAGRVLPGIAAAIIMPTAGCWVGSIQNTLNWKVGAPYTSGTLQSNTADNSYT